MDPRSDHSDQQSDRSPLAKVGLAVLGILIIPMFLYSNGPGGPIKEGDIVFSTGRHRVDFVKPSQFQETGYESFCVLEPQEQLIVTQRPAARSDGSLLARPLSNSIRTFPLCPQNADLILQYHQASLQMDTWSNLKDTVSSLFSFETLN